LSRICGRDRWTMRDRQPVNSITKDANSKIVNSVGCPD
jgi:hypothetical protein